MIKLNIKNDSEEVRNLTKLMVLAAKHGEAGAKAREAIAAFIGPVITQVLDQKATHRAFFNKYNFNFGTAPTLPLDAFDSNEEGLIDIWHASIAGGLATNHVSGGDEYRMVTFPFNTALSMLRKNAEEGRFEILVKALERMAQEVMVKEAFTAWNTILRPLGAARTNGDAHVIASTSSGVFQLDDVNRLKTKATRLRNSWLGGTEVTGTGQGFTHLVISPEIAEAVRSWAYEPMNTRSGAVATSGATAIPLPEQIRMSIYNNSGLLSIPGVGSFVELKEFGVGQSLNTVFDNAYTASGGDPAFDGATQELVLAVDLSVGAGIQMSASDSDRSSELKVEEDDTFSKRSGRFGYYAEGEIGFGWLDQRALLGILV